MPNHFLLPNNKPGGRLVAKAEVGMFNSDRFRLAVSADVSTFFDGLSVDNATAIADQPRLPRYKAYTNQNNYVGVGAWTKIGLNNIDPDHGKRDEKIGPFRGFRSIAWIIHLVPHSKAVH